MTNIKQITKYKNSNTENIVIWYLILEIYELCESRVGLFKEENTKKY